MDKTKNKPSSGWSVYYIIETIAKCLDVKDFLVDVSPAVEKIAYDSKNKTIRIKDENEDGICVWTLAHELYHHYQNVNGLLPSQDSDEVNEYGAFRYKMHTDYNPNFTWTYLTFPWEAQAEIFSRVFLERYYRYLNKIGVFTDENLKIGLEDAAQMGVPKKFLPRHRKYVEQFKGDLLKLYKAFEAKYTDKIDATLELMLSRQDDEQYSFEIIP